MAIFFRRRRCCCWPCCGGCGGGGAGRWPGLLFFVGTLLPVLGFCNVFPFLYSYVADHFQYLASLGIITLAAAGMATLSGAMRTRGENADSNWPQDADATDHASLRRALPR